MLIFWEKLKPADGKVTEATTKSKELQAALNEALSRDKKAEGVLTEVSDQVAGLNLEKEDLEQGWQHGVQRRRSCRISSWGWVRLILRARLVS